MKKLLSVLCLALILSSLLVSDTPSTYAAPSESSHTIKECKKGGLELDTFLQTVIGQNGFDQLLQPIWDLFRNECQVMDIMALEQEIDSVQKEIQQAFLMCDREEIPSLERAYYELDAELYYVRHLTKLKFGSAMGELLDTATMGVVDLGDKKNVEFEDPSVIYGDMFERYYFDIDVFSSVGPDEFDILFQTIVAKYEPRKEKYRDCDESGWERVKEKFEEFIDNLGGLREGAEAIEESVLEGAEAIQESAEEYKKMGSSFAEGFVKNAFDVKLNGLSPKKGFQEIVDEVKKNDFWSSGSNSAEHGAVLKAVSAVAEGYESKVEMAKLEAKYESLYKYNTDSHVREFLRAMDETEFYIVKGIAMLKEVDRCVERMVKKQCPKK